MPEIQIIPIDLHFDTEQHFLSIEEFHTFCMSIKDIADNINTSVCDSSLKYTLVILPPEEGSFLKRMGIVGAVWLAAWYGIESDVGKAFIKGFTAGHEPAYYAENAGAFLRDMTIGFLRKDSRSVENIDQEQFQLEKAFRARNNFYSACSKSKNIKALGFDESEDFPITKESFPSYLVVEPILEDEASIFYKFHKVTIVSPVTIQGSNAKWRTRIKPSGEILNFYLEDQEFKNAFFNGSYPLKESEQDDEMIIRVKYTPMLDSTGKKYHKKEAVKVYSINNHIITPLPEGAVFDTPQDLNPTQMDLFNDAN